MTEQHTNLKTARLNRIARTVRDHDQIAATLPDRVIVVSPAVHPDGRIEWHRDDVFTMADAVEILGY